MNSEMTKLRERIMARVVMNENDCWLWTGWKSDRGYGLIRFQGRRVRTHRAMVLDDLGSNLHVLHKCDVPNCVNPAHLWLGTNAENMADKVAKNRQSRGETNGQSKLTEEQVIEIRAKYAVGVVTQQQLADECGVSNQQINRIITGKKWSHLS